MIKFSSNANADLKLKLNSFEIRQPQKSNYDFDHSKTIPDTQGGWGFFICIERKQQVINV